MGNPYKLLTMQLLASSNISPAIFFIIFYAATIFPQSVASQYAFSLNGTSHMRLTYNTTPVSGIYGQWYYHSADARQAPPLIIVYNETGAVSCAVQSSIPGAWNSFKFALNATGLLCIINDGASEEFQPLDYQFTTPGNKLVTTAGPQPSRVFNEVLLQIGTGGFAGCIENMTFSFTDASGDGGGYLSCDQLTTPGFKSPKFSFQQQGVQCGCLFPVITSISTTTALVPSTTPAATVLIPSSNAFISSSTSAAQSGGFSFTIPSATAHGLNTSEDFNTSSIIEILEKGGNFTTPTWQENQTLKSVCSPNPCPMNMICVETPNIGSGYNCSPTLPPPQSTIASTSLLITTASTPSLINPASTPPLINICAGNPCRNNGTCIQLDTRDGTTYRCQCLPRFTGQNCTLLINVCDSTPCDNGATCVVNPADPKGYVCQCTDGFWGENCTRMNPCRDGPCLNNGTCAPKFLDRQKDQDFGFQSFDCTCAPGFKGDICNISLCKNGGVWNPTERNCSCQPGYYGLNCDWSNVCELNEASSSASAVSSTTAASSGSLACKNGGICRMVPANFCYNCIAFVNLSCNPTDLHCMAAECDANRPCEQVKHSLSCECPPNFTGPDCSLPMTISLSPLTTNSANSTSISGIAIATTPALTSSTASSTSSTMSTSIFPPPSFPPPPFPSPAISSTNFPATQTTVEYPASGGLGISTQAPSTDQKSGGTRVGEIVGGILGALLAIAVVVGAIFLYKYVRNSRKLKGKYNPAREENQTGNGPPVPMLPIDKEERLI